MIWLQSSSHYEDISRQFAFMRANAFVCLDYDLAWSRSRGLLAYREPSHPAHKHCRLSRGVKGLRAVRPEWRPVDFLLFRNSASIRVMVSSGQYGQVVDPAWVIRPGLKWGIQKRKYKGPRDLQEQKPTPYPKGNHPRAYRDILPT